MRVGFRTKEKNEYVIDRHVQIFGYNGHLIKCCASW